MLSANEKLAGGESILQRAQGAQMVLDVVIRRNRENPAALCAL